MAKQITTTLITAADKRVFVCKPVNFSMLKITKLPYFLP
jgi:hypothetical protein